MNNLLKTTLIGLFFGTFGTTIGGIIGVTVKNTSKKFLSFILAFASGLMISIVCFDLIPEAFNLTGILNVFIGIVLGMFGGYFLNYFIMGTCEINMLRFSKIIEPMSYVYSVLITVVFTLIVNFVTYFALKKIDMIESLKSIEWYFTIIIKKHLKFIPKYSTIGMLKKTKAFYLA